MAAYAALGSLIHLMDHIQKYDSCNQLFLEKQQKELQSLQTKVSFLQNFLGGYFHRGSEEARVLENQIVNAAYAAEDLIESHILDNIHAMSPSPIKRSLTDFSHGIRKIINDMELIEEEIKNVKKDVLDSTPVDSLRRMPSKNEPMVLFDVELRKMRDELTGPHHSESFHIISITGMGGIGKTTLARQVYRNPGIMEKFDIQGWVTIPQDNNVRQILCELLEQTGAHTDQTTLKNLPSQELGLKLHKHLSSRRYLIVLDDVWSIETWEKIILYLPKNKGSGVLVTARNVNVAKGIGSPTLLVMKLLDDNKSWGLFCREVFVQESCPPELSEIGKRITRNCRGLPLSIVVVGGLLAKYKLDVKYWEYVAKDTSSAVNSADDEVCFKILLLSYNNLPAHLKSCFLYTGVYPEDHQIRVTDIVRLWIAEGFIKPVRSKSLEEVGQDCLDNLIDRNLISILTWGCTGKKKVCKIHDLLRDLSLTECLRERFLCVAEVDDPGVSQKISKQRRVAIHTTIPDKNYGKQSSGSSELQPFPRSLSCYFEMGSIPSINSRFLRVLNVLDEISPKDIFHLVNSRYLRFGANISKFPASVSKLWDLQTLVITNKRMGIAPSTVWKMPQLRHLIVEAGFFLPDPPKIDCALENLETLVKVVDFRFSKGIINKIRNIKKLKMSYLDQKELSFARLDNLECLEELRTLECEFPLGKYELKLTNLLENLKFPKSITSLTLSRCKLDSEDMIQKIVSLPKLEKLNLKFCFLGKTWELGDEDRFESLKYMELYESDLVNWIADDYHFPALERLIIAGMQSLKEIPYEFGDINPLELIRMTKCSQSAVESAKKILEYRRRMENGIILLYVDHELISIATSSE